MRVLDRLMLTVIGLLFIAMFYIAYLVIFPLKVIDIKAVRIIQPTVRAGTHVTYAVDSCKYVEAASEVHISIVNASIVSVPVVQSGRPPGCHNNVTRDVDLPNNLSPGEHHLEVDVVYHLNPFHTSIVHYRTPDFLVTQSKSNGE